MNLVDYLYNETIDTFLENVDNINIKENYKEYLSKVYSKYNFEELKKLNKLESVVNLEKNKWKNKFLNYKKSMVIKDDNFDKLLEFSNTFYQLALNKLKTGENINIDVGFYQKHIDFYFQNILDFNKQSAQTIYSETILDLNYAAGNSEFMSLRIGRETRSGINSKEVL